MKIIMDTNILFLPGQMKIDIFRELEGNELIVLDSTLKELRKLAASKGKNGTSAKIAVELIKQKNISVASSKGGDTDTAIANYALAHGCAVATNDKKLMERLKKSGIKIMRMRQKKYLEEY